MRVVQITDTHVPADARDQTVLEMLCAVETVDPVVNLQIILDDIRTLDPAPDFVIATGDLADRGHPGELPPAARAARAARGPRLRIARQPRPRRRVGPAPARRKRVGRRCVRTRRMAVRVRRRRQHRVGRALPRAGRRSRSRDGDARRRQRLPVHPPSAGRGARRVCRRRSSWPTISRRCCARIRCAPSCRATCTRSPTSRSTACRCTPGRRPTSARPGPGYRIFDFDGDDYETRAQTFSLFTMTDDQRAATHRSVTPPRPRTRCAVYAATRPKHEPSSSTGEPTPHTDPEPPDREHMRAASSSRTTVLSVETCSCDTTTMTPARAWCGASMPAACATGLSVSIARCRVQAPHSRSRRRGHRRVGGRRGVTGTHGDRVILSLTPVCGSCWHCLRQETHLCEMGSAVTAGAIVAVRRPDECRCDFVLTAVLRFDRSARGVVHPGQDRPAGDIAVPPADHHRLVAPRRPQRPIRPRAIGGIGVAASVTSVIFRARALSVVGRSPTTRR